MKFMPAKTMWSGKCPRCDTASYYSITWTHPFPDGTTFDVLECPAGHPFVICTNGGSRQHTLFILPISGAAGVPLWMPDEYKEAWSEMLFDFHSRKYRSAIALAGMILDAHVNSLLKHEGDKRKPLAKRLEILAQAKQIDSDQFADATVTRLSRNEVAHPETISIAVTEGDAKDALEAVEGCLERFFKWRNAKALPAPQDQVEGTPATEN